MSSGPPSPASLAGAAFSALAPPACGPSSRGSTRKTIVLGSIWVLAQEKSTWLTPLTSGTIRSSSTSVALGLSNWISTRWRGGSVISLILAEATGGAAASTASPKSPMVQVRCRIAMLLDFPVAP